jgi:hypothetical protein
MKKNDDLDDFLVIFTLGLMLLMIGLLIGISI